MSDGIPPEVRARLWAKREQWGEAWADVLRLALAPMAEDDQDRVRAKQAWARVMAQAQAGEDEDPRFEAVWQAIKHWDIERFPGNGRARATGDDVRAILAALDEVQ